MPATQHVGQAGEHHQRGEQGSHVDLAAQQGALPGQFALHRLHRGRTGVVVAAGGGVEFDRHPGLAQYDRTFSSLWFPDYGARLDP